MKYDGTRHKELQERVLAICERLGQLDKSGETASTSDEMRALYKERNKLTEEGILLARSIKVKDAVWSFNYCGWLICARKEVFSDIGYVHYLSQDGKTFNWERWHNGPTNTDEQVYVEIHREKDYWSHGWVDGDSRLVTQIG